MQTTRKYSTMTALAAAVCLAGLPGVAAASKLINPWKFLGPNCSPSGLVAHNGAYYGVTSIGGAKANGTVFELQPAAGGTWQQTVLYSFKGGADGGGAAHDVVFDSQGSLYGVTESGGSSACLAFNCGTVYQLTPPSTGHGAWTHTILYSFGGGADGYEPNAVTVYNGALYGSTDSGGINNNGTVFELSPPATAGAAWSKTTILSFTGSPNSSQPFSNPIIFDANGNLYSTATAGGTGSHGTVFELTPPATPGGAWTETVLHSFTGGTDGVWPEGLQFDSSGNLFGTTNGCLFSSNSCTIFELTPPAQAGGSWTENTLHVFAGGALGNPDGTIPNRDLALDPSGAIYGSTTGGGNGNCSFADAWGCGTIFELTPPASGGGSWTETMLYEFTGGADAFPTNVLLDNNGNLTGVTLSANPSAYGSGSNGSLFQLSPPAVAGNPWTKTIAYSFAGGDGFTPISGLVADPQGVLYGVTYYGGAGTCNDGLHAGCGTVYQVKPPAKAGKPWTEEVIYSFAGGADGAYPNLPYGTLAIDSNGALYGTTSAGGSAGNQGTVFQLSPPSAAGGAWTKTILYSFSADGLSYPASSVVFDATGVLYGSTNNGGSKGRGAIFQLTPPTTPGGAWTETTLYNFLDSSEYPVSLVLHKGSLYGSTYGHTSYGFSAVNGTIFELKPPASPGGAWKETTIHQFAGGVDGTQPYGILFDKQGAIYGTTAGGGQASCAHKKYGCGVVFQLMPPATPGSGWQENILYSFSGSDGSDPVGLAFDGVNLVGTAATGGSAGGGTIFQLAPPATTGAAWTLNTLYTFTGPTGGSPQSVSMMNGKLFGVAAGGGINYGGTVFVFTF